MSRLQEAGSEAPTQKRVGGDKLRSDGYKGGYKGEDGELNSAREILGMSG